MRNEESVGIAMSVMAVALFLVLFAINIPDSPASWGDWAGWFQAVGSIVAIVCSFRLGKLQADRARLDAIDSEVQGRTRKEKGYQSVVHHLVNETDSLRAFVDKYDADTFGDSWESFLKPAAMAALAAFDSLPSYDLGTTERISAAFALREEAQDFFGEISRALAASDRQAAYANLREGNPQRLKHLTDLSKTFADAYKPEHSS
jgi:hypothetical protein